MIGKAEAISHGHNNINYVTGESRNKENKRDKITHIMNQLMSNDLDAQGIWQSFQLDLVDRHAKMTNTVIRMELSPEKKQTDKFTPEDWQQLWHDYVEEFDKQVFINQQKNEVISERTHLANSKATLWLHQESDSGIPHLHAAVCRMDPDGNTNNDHFIHRRAIFAAEEVALKRGWMTARKIHKNRAKALHGECVEILQKMKKWDWNTFESELNKLGYSVKAAKRHANGMPYGYAITLGKLIYKSSEIGEGRHFMTSKIENTWKKLHPVPKEEHKPTERPMHQPSEQKPSVAPTPKAKPSATPTMPVIPKVNAYSQHRDNSISYDLPNDENGTSRVWIPEKVSQHFKDEFDYRFVENCDDCIKMAATLFVAWMDNWQVSSGGGGGNNSGWRDKDDEMERARQAALAVPRFIKPKKKSRSFSR